MKRRMKSPEARVDVLAPRKQTLHTRLGDESQSADGVSWLELRVELTVSRLDSVFSVCRGTLCVCVGGGAT